MAQPFVLDLQPDRAHFLTRTGDWLAGDPVRNTIITSLAHRTDARPAPGSWWLSVHDHRGHVVGAGMRTAPGGRRPPYLVAMPDAATSQLAELLLARAEVITAVNGHDTTTRRFADHVAGATGQVVSEHMLTRLHEVRTVLPPTRPPGELRRPTSGEVDLVTDWLADFTAESDAQGGRSEADRDPILPAPTRSEVARRIDGGELWVWSDGSRPVHLTGFRPPSYGVARIGPVYTPQEFRGHGYAGATVAELSARLLGEGNRVCLFTDQANPVSNQLYAKLGYEAVTDTVGLHLDPAPPR
ncbi:GNAT family N-acetyltransferase [Microlunatus sp. Y2014]|uniref:GNAT family N-acetyltransferase n=1 Tax=Microlunatus sp. Y2014 TaxID=3418488 RepID=UPI003DA753B8